MRREFTRLWNQKEAICPNIFFLTRGSESHFDPKDWVSEEYRLYVVCQDRTHAHHIGNGYSLRQDKERWIDVGPWLNRLIKFLRLGIPMGKTLEGVYNAVAMQALQPGTDLMEEIINNIPMLATSESMETIVSKPHMGEDIEAVGPALRALDNFLKQPDPSQKWGALNKTSTPDGNILWLCGEHWQEYQSKPLHLDI